MPIRKPKTEKPAGTLRAKPKKVTEPKEWVEDKGRWKPVEEPEPEVEPGDAPEVVERKEQAALVAIQAIKLAQELGKGAASAALGDGLVKSATRVGILIRGAARTRSDNDALVKLRQAEDSVDEVVYWLELLRECKLGNAEDVQSLADAADALCEGIVGDLKVALKRSTDRPSRNQGGGGGFSRGRDGGDRPPRRDFGDRPKRDFGDRPPRDFGDRPPRDFGDRPSRSYGDRPARSYGDRPERSFDDRPRRTYGDRPARSFNDDRPKRTYKRRED